MVVRCTVRITARADPTVGAVRIVEIGAVPSTVKIGDSSEIWLAEAVINLCQTDLIRQRRQASGSTDLGNGVLVGDIITTTTWSTASDASRSQAVVGSYTIDAVVKERGGENSAVIE